MAASGEVSISDPVAFGPQFDAAFRAEFETLLRWRRDVRRFRTDAVDPVLIEACLDAACLAPSVGYSQPWRFVDVRSADARAAVRANFAAANAEALAEYQGARARQYAELKLAGLEEAPVQFAVFTCGGTTVGHGLGRRTMPQTLDFSTVLAVQNFWLTARAAGIGVGWVSIFDPGALVAALDVPAEWRLTAYLCVGHPQQAADSPELARVGWEAPHGPAREVLRR